MHKQRRGLNSALYHASFTIFILILAALLTGSAWGLGEQAWRTDHQRRWNMFAMIAAYVALALISIVHMWSRVLSVKKILRTMPKPYMPTKQVDVGKKVAREIETEYTRTAVIAHISQATTADQEGWGRPGSPWDQVHFRTYIMSTLPEMRALLLPPDTTIPPLALTPLIVSAESLSDTRKPGLGKPDPLRVFVASYCAIVERARYAAAEPCESDAAAVEKVVALVKQLVEVKKLRREGRSIPEEVAV